MKITGFSFSVSHGKIQRVRLAKLFERRPVELRVRQARK